MIAQESNIHLDGLYSQRRLKLRVLLITGSFPPMRCGVGDYCYNLAKSLNAESGVTIGILTSTSVKIKTLSDSGIELFPVIETWSLIEALKVIKIILQWSPDIVHIQYPTQGYGNGLLPWMMPLISFFLRKKVVQTWHEEYSRRNAPWLFLKSLVPSGLIFVRPQYKDNLHSHLRWVLWQKKIVFIPNASAIPRVELSAKLKNILRNKYLKKQKRLIVFFGFVYPHKGIELLFDIADPNLDQIIIAGEINDNSEYFHQIIKHTLIEPWKGKVTITGFLSAKDAAELLAVTDVVILPFRAGGGEWNTSIHGAVLNGAFVITTSLTQNGYDKKRNVYFAKVDDIQEMSLALNTYTGCRRNYDVDIDGDEWKKIAKQHVFLYEDILPN